MSGIKKRTALMVIDLRKGSDSTYHRPTGWNRVITDQGEFPELGSQFQYHQLDSGKSYNIIDWTDMIARVDEIRFIDPDQLPLELADSRIHNGRPLLHAGY
jgi:hypothetical protein